MRTINAERIPFGECSRDVQLALVMAHCRYHNVGAKYCDGPRHMFLDHHVYRVEVPDDFEYLPKDELPLPREVMAWDGDEKLAKRKVLQAIVPSLEPFPFVCRDRNDDCGILFKHIKEIERPEAKDSGAGASFLGLVR